MSAGGTVVRRPPVVSTLGALSAAAGPAGSPNFVTQFLPSHAGPAQHITVSADITAKSTGKILLVAQGNVIADPANVGDPIVFFPIRGGSALSLGLFAVAVASPFFTSPLAWGTIAAISEIPVGATESFGIDIVDNIPGHLIAATASSIVVNIVEL